MEHRDCCQCEQCQDARERLWLAEYKKDVAENGYVEDKEESTIEDLSGLW